MGIKPKLAAILITAMLLSLASALIAVRRPSVKVISASPDDFGYNVQGQSAQDMNTGGVQYVYGSIFTCYSDNATVDNIKAYLSGGYPCKALIYLENGTLLATSNEVYADGLTTFSFASSPNINATNYILAIEANTYDEGLEYIYYDENDTLGRYYASTYNYPTPDNPATFSTSNQEFSIWCTYTPTVTNVPPNKPTNLLPSTYQITTSVNISCVVTDNENDKINVFFYEDNTTKSLINNIWIYSGQTAQVTWNGLTRNANHSFFTRGQDNNGNWGENSSDQTFFIPSLPTSSTPLLPQDNGCVTSSPTIRWTPTKDNLYLEIATDNLFTSIVENDNISNILAKSTSLTAGKKYWRLKISDNYGQIAYSSIFSFTLTALLTENTWKISDNWDNYYFLQGIDTSSPLKPKIWSYSDNSINSLRENYYPSDVILYSDNSQYDVSTYDWTVANTVTIGIYGTLKVYFEVRCTDGVGGLANLYRNGNSIGTQRTISSTSWVGFTENLSGFSENDILTLKMEMNYGEIYVFSKSLQVSGSRVGITTFKSATLNLENGGIDNLKLGYSDKNSSFENGKSCNTRIYDNTHSQIVGEMDNVSWSDWVSHSFTYNISSYTGNIQFLWQTDTDASNNVYTTSYLIENKALNTDIWKSKTRTLMSTKIPSQIIFTTNIAQNENIIENIVIWKSNVETDYSIYLENGSGKISLGLVADNIKIYLTLQSDNSLSHYPTILTLILQSGRANVTPVMVSNTIPNPILDSGLCNISTATDNDNDSITFYYQWYQDNAIMSGQNTYSLLPTYALSGHSYYCKVTPWDGHENGTYSNSNDITVPDLLENSYIFGYNTVGASWLDFSISGSINTYGSKFFNPTFIALDNVYACLSVATDYQICFYSEIYDYSSGKIVTKSENVVISGPSTDWFSFHFITGRISPGYYVITVESNVTDADQASISYAGGDNNQGYNLTENPATFSQIVPYLSYYSIDSYKYSIYIGGYSYLYELPIYTIDNLQAIDNHLNLNYSLQNDIDASATINWNGGRGFKPIGFAIEDENYHLSDWNIYPFVGKFEGNNHIIHNMYINFSDYGNVNGDEKENIISGIFRVMMYGGIIENLGIEKENVISTAMTGGGLVGLMAPDTTIVNCYSINSILDFGTGDAVGGLVGSSARGYIIHCYFGGSIFGHNNVGGLVGNNDGRIDYCYVTSEANAVANEGLGGFCGINADYQWNWLFTGYYSDNNYFNRTGYITNCYSRSIISGEVTVGGFVGSNFGGIIENCASEGIVNGVGVPSEIGGFVGYAYGGYTFENFVGGVIKNCYSTAEVNSGQSGGFAGLNEGIIDSCYSTGLIIGNNTEGFCGYNINVILNCFWDNEASIQSTSWGGTGKTTENMKNVRTFTDNVWSIGLTTPWDFANNPYYDKENSDVWKIDSENNGGYPYLASIGSAPFVPTVEGVFAPAAVNVNTYFTLNVEVREYPLLNNITSVEMRLYENILTKDSPDNIRNHYEFMWTSENGFEAPSPDGYILKENCVAGSGSLLEDNWKFVVKLSNLADIGSWNAWVQVIDNSGLCDNEEFVNLFGVLNPPPTVENFEIETLDNTLENQLNVDTYYKFKVEVQDNDNLSDVNSVELRLYENTLTKDAADNTRNHYTFTFSRGSEGSLIGTSTDSLATAYNCQRKCFYDNGRYWAWYCDNYNFVFSSSLDGQSWASVTSVGNDTGGNASVWFDGFYVHYVRFWAFWNGENYSYDLYYRRGIPNSDGTIAWSSTEQLVDDQTSNYAWSSSFPSIPSITVDDENHAWIGTSYWNGSGYYARVFKDANSDGTWANASGFPYILSGAADGYWFVTIVPLTSENVWAFGAVSSSDKVMGKFWNGSSWGGDNEIGYTFIGGSNYSAAVSNGGAGDIYLVMSDQNGAITFWFRYLDNWVSDGDVADAVGNAAPCLVQNTAGGLYCFWSNDNHIYYNTFDGWTWGSPTDWLNETAEGLTDKITLTSFYENYGDIGIMYMTKAQSPFNVKFASLAGSLVSGGVWNSSPSGYLLVENCVAGNDNLTTDNWTFVIKLGKVASPTNWNVWAQVIDSSGAQDNKEFVNAFSVNQYLYVSYSAYSLSFSGFPNQTVEAGENPVVATITSNDSFHIDVKVDNETWTSSGGYGTIYAENLRADKDGSGPPYDLTLSTSYQTLYDWDNWGEGLARDTYWFLVVPNGTYNNFTNQIEIKITQPG